jgi:cobalt/nickel transport system permease protein
MGGAHHFIDAQGESRRLVMAVDGRVKLALLAAALMVNLTAGGTHVPLLLLLAAFALVLSGGIRGAAFGKRMIVPATLALVAFLTQLFWVRQGEIVTTLNLYFFSLAVHQGGLQKGLELSARIVGGMGVLLFFSLTTPLPEMMRAARFFRCPPLLVELALIMYRYIFLLLEEGGRIRNAQKARLGFVDFRRGLHSSAVLGGMLVLRTYDRAEHSFDAMRCRGYRGALTTVLPVPMQRRDWLALAAGLLMLAGLYAMR